MGPSTQDLVFQFLKSASRTEGYPAIWDPGNPKTWVADVWICFSCADPFERVMNLHFLSVSGLSKLRALAYHTHGHSRWEVLPEMVGLLARKLQTRPMGVCI